ncbi:hypothetical protein RI129_003810 [Pyrocoelia pectoralis]|uniref:Kinesin motor domain-containing protein n=1 Tax=Pyrocoelia pectoralis TaxID=417401 RepID=A0AAN7VRF0_9COLE
MPSEKDTDSVQVAVRIRPLIDSEINRGCRDILEVLPALHQIRIKDSDRAFTFNHVCDSSMSQNTFYDVCVKHIIANLFKGYNVTILAYGQTGSGKTYSMGTAYDSSSDIGIIPRAVNDIFNYANDNFAYDFHISVSFMELYQEMLYDLLTSKSREQSVVEIREDSKGSIIIPGLTTETVTSSAQALDMLLKGSKGRVTGSTNMNTQSSRSHAIFTINILMQQKSDSNMNKSAKFYLVDLAGSERSKKTGATGVAFREGININKGLLALGNVISVLGGDKQQSYVSFRDSNLTRLLKDSLGGNSITLMIACVSPADYNLEETVSTLRYADRARQIKNKPVVNEDPKAAEINRLNKLVAQLRLELIGQGGPIICQAELEQLKKDNEEYKMKIRDLTRQLSSTLNENTSLFERVMLLQSANEQITKKLHDLQDEYNSTINNICVEDSNPDTFKEQMAKLHSIQNLFTELYSETQKNEEEIRKHERCFSGTNSDQANLVVAESEFSKRQETHTKQQLALNSELQQLTKELAMKEYLAEQMLINNNHIIDYEAVTENENKVAVLQKERDELLQQLKNVQSHDAGNKIAEQRRKRVQELEKEIQDLHKRITEQAKLIKHKQKDEQKIILLNNEIRQMKSNKVKLIKSMKQESEKFRSWKLQRERELLKLKEQDRKRLNQIVKMETIHNRQQNVLKRKVEEAAAINKRLKDALALRKNVQDQKNSGKTDKIEVWLTQELDIFINTAFAEESLTHLLEDRAVLQKQLDSLKESPDFEDGAEIKQLQDDIDFRCMQIQDLQQKVLDSDQENKSRTRWENIQTMGDAKFALKVLFDLAASKGQQEVSASNKCKDLQSNYESIQGKYSSFEDEKKQWKLEHRREIAQLTKEYEEKVSVLLRQLRRMPLEDVKEEYQERYNIQQLELEKHEQEIERLKQMLLQFEEDRQITEEALTKKNNDLQNRLEEIKEHAETVLEESNDEKRKRSNNVSNEVLNITVEDDIENDPDWRKTPLGKRIQRLRNSSMAVVQPPPRLIEKRNYEGGCNCKGTCSKRNCGCKRASISCTPQCKCSQDCVNKGSNENEDMTEIVSIETFKKPRSMDDDSSSNSSINDHSQINCRPRRTQKVLFAID